MDTTTTIKETIKPKAIGYMPDSSIFLKSVLRPTAARAIAMRNLLTCFKGCCIGIGMKPRVLATAPTANNKINHGKSALTLTPLVDLFWAPTILYGANIEKISAMGTMDVVRVSLTIVAKSPAASLNA